MKYICECCGETIEDVETCDEIDYLVDEKRVHLICEECYKSLMKMIEAAREIVLV